jgi:hypothetical protein
MKKIIKPFLATIILTIFYACSLNIDIPEDTIVSKPIISISSLSSPSQITLSTDTNGAKIYYTLDGTIPNPSSYYYGSTHLYSNPIFLYNPTTVKAIATKTGLEDSEVVIQSLAIEPVSLSIGDTHNFNGLEITLNDIFWYQWQDFYGAIYQTDKIAFEFSIKNNTGKTLDTNPIYAWGNIIEYPSSLQLNELYYSSIYSTNMDVFTGYSILPTASIVTAIYFNAASNDATSFKFFGEPTFEYEGTFNDVGYYFEIEFNREDVNTKAIE